MAKIRIGVDIDGVMYQWEKTARYMLRDVLPNSPYKDILTETSSEWFDIKKKVDKKHWNWLWEEGVKLGLFRYGHLYPGTIQAMRGLAKIGDVVLITHRPKQAVTDTLAWLALQDLPLSGLHILVNQEPKSEVRPKVDFFVDDKIENIIDMSQVGTRVALMRRPWNASFSWHWTVENLDQFRREIEWPKPAPTASVPSVG